MFPKRLKELRLEADMKQLELGEILEISPSTIGMYEQGRRFPDQEILLKIANFFDVTTDYLFGRTDERNTNIKRNKIDINKNEKDIEELIDKTMNQILRQDGLMLNGEIVDDNDRILLRNALKNGIEYVKSMKSKK